MEELINLHSAFEANNHIEIEKILNSGALNSAQVSAFVLQASGKGSLFWVQRLIQYGADVNTRGASGRTPLLLASQLGNAELVRVLVDAGADVSCAMVDGAPPPLFAAAAQGHEQVVTVLLEKGAAVEERHRTFTPLMVACVNDRLEVVKLLLDKGADLTLATSKGKTPMSLAVEFQRSKISACLRKSALAQLFAAARACEPQKAHRLVNVLGVSAADPHGRTPLEIAVRSGDMKVLRGLMMVEALRVEANRTQSSLLPRPSAGVWL